MTQKQKERDRNDTKTDGQRQRIKTVRQRHIITQRQTERDRE